MKSQTLQPKLGGGGIETGRALEFTASQFSQIGEIQLSNMAESVNFRFSERPFLKSKMERC